MHCSISSILTQQEALKQAVVERFSIDPSDFDDMLFFRASRRSVSLGRIQELPLESMTDDSIACDWSQMETIINSLTQAAVHLIRQRAHANVLSLGAKETELFLGHVPVTLEVHQETTTPGFVILEHCPIVLGIGWLNTSGQLIWYTSDSSASSAREESGTPFSNQLH
jgi:hypothetical protein